MPYLHNSLFIHLRSFRMCFIHSIIIIFFTSPKHTQSQSGALRSLEEKNVYFCDFSPLLSSTPLCTFVSSRRCWDAFAFGYDDDDEEGETSREPQERENPKKSALINNPSDLHFFLVKNSFLFFFLLFPSSLLALFVVVLVAKRSNTQPPSSG